MGIRETIVNYIPLVIPELRNEDGSNRIHFGFIPEDEEKTPAMAYVISDEFNQIDLEGEVYAEQATVRFGIICQDILLMDTIKHRMLNLVGPGKLPGVQLITLADAGDADPDLTLDLRLVGYEIALTFHL